MVAMVMFFFFLSSLYSFAAKSPEKPIQAVYVPSHLFHMLFELFKVNSQTHFMSWIEVINHNEHVFISP